MYLSTLLLLFPAISTASLTITIPPSTILPNPNSLPPSTHASLTSLSNPNANSNYPLTAPLTRSSTFNFPKVDSASTPESFLLDIRSPGYVFAPFRVDVASDGSILGVWETFRGNSWDNRGPEKFVADSDSAGRKEVTVSAKVVARRKFFEERATFSPLSLLKNPMILLALVALAFTFGMPKLMQNMDPEMREEFEKHSRSSPISGATRNAMAGGGGGPGNFDLAGWMAGASSGAGQSANSAEGATGRDTGSARRRG